jgi:nucleoside-diphosphate-sugar epimerase
VLTGFDVINVGTETHTTVNQLVEEIFDILEYRPKAIDHQLDKPVGVMSRAADCTKNEELFGWHPSTSVREGVEKTIEWYQASTSPERLKDLDSLLMTR